MNTTIITPHQFQPLKRDRPGKSQTDPVCHMMVAPDPYRRIEHGGRDFYFCSDKCMGKFRANPAAFVGDSSKPEASTVSLMELSIPVPCTRKSGSHRREIAPSVG
jgi:YHS domain-containing protein